MTTPAFPAGTILGYPRIGRRRELKRALEQHWAGEIDEAELDRVTAELRRATRERLATLGLGRGDLARIARNSFEGSFLGEADKAARLAEIDAYVS
jgi:5-methyltetrahydropteroyltriglutamate--homocysteine methyltransferase